MDIRCEVCGEPWDVYGLSHGDVKAWEADAIKKGLGCPCCKHPKKNYEPIKKFENILTCSECAKTVLIHIDDIFYDGSRKYFCDNQGKVYLDNKNDVSAFAIEVDRWGIIENELLCEKCLLEYSECDHCGRMVPEEESVYIQSYNDCCCLDCYANNYFSCNKCGDFFVVEDDLNLFEDSEYCSYCINQISKVCGICDERISIDDIIIGKNEENCCSEKCADEAATGKV